MTALAARLLQATPAGSRGEELLKSINENGGRNELLLSTNSVMFLSTAPSYLSATLVKLAAERLRARAFDPVEFEEAGRKLSRQIEMMKGMKTELFLKEKLRGLSFLDVPARRPVSGRIGDIERLKLEETLTHMRRIFLPSSSYIVITGNFEEAALTRLLREELEPIPAGEFHPPEIPKESPQKGKRTAVFCLPLNAEWIGISYRIPTEDPGGEDLLNIISAIFSAGRSSHARDEMPKALGVAVTADSQPFFFEEGWLLTIAAGPLPPGIEGERLAAEIAAYIEDLSSKVGEPDMRRAINLLRFTGMEQLFSPEGLAVTIARNYREGKGMSLPRPESAFSGISLAEITRLLDALGPENRSTVILRPEHACQN